MPGLQGDIDYSLNIDNGETTFRANTPKGQEFLGDPERTVSSADALTLIGDARAAGLTVRSSLL
jgi:hypothetical protein